MEPIHQNPPHHDRVPSCDMESCIRILHASPDAPAIDVYANNCLIVSNLSFKELSCYLPVIPGMYNIKVFPACNKETPVLETVICVAPGTVYTIAAIGKLKNLGLMPIVDAVGCNNYCSACVRFVHLSPNAPAVDITLTCGTTLFDNVSFTDVTNYIPVPPDVYNLQVRLACTKTVVLDVPNIKLESGKYYTIYAVGLVGETPPLQALLAEDMKGC